MALQTTCLLHGLGDTEQKCMRTEKEGLCVERENSWKSLEFYIMHLLKLIRLAQSLFSLLFYFIRLAQSVFLFSSILSASQQSFFLFSSKS